MTKSCTLQLCAKDVAFGPFVLACMANQAHQNSIDIKFVGELPANAAACHLTTPAGVKFTKQVSVMRYLCRAYLRDMYETHQGTVTPEKSTTIDNFLHEVVTAADFDTVRQNLARIDGFVALRSYMVGYTFSLADVHMWAQLRATPVFLRDLKRVTAGADAAAFEFPHLLRWYRTIDEQEGVQAALVALQAQLTAVNKSKKDQASFEIALPGAEMGKVVTRFPPEPSGYMHIGHTKAALLNEYFARKYQGELIVRFDDTNPSKEKMEFEEAIIEDLRLIGVKGDRITHTSDYFEEILGYCDKLLREGKGYVDDTDQETMRHERMHGIASRNRDNSVEENLRRWTEMQAATEFGLKCCVRAKMSVDDPNKALRDPVMYRCNLTPHHKTGRTYNVYPTYDFACPIVDSLEGVTHALRTNEYRDRNPQYEWVLTALGLRKVHIWDYSRMNFVYTLLSKRKLQWFVDNGHVAGWDDPRFPTVRGIRRRGMTIDALKQYVLMQGPSTNTLLLEWDKFWAINKKVIDPVAPRHVALDADSLVPLELADGPAAVEWRDMPRHKKNPELGNKRVAFFRNLVLAGADADAIANGEEVTLMDWGNAIVERVERDAAGKAVKLHAKLNLAGDVKVTKKKLTWLVDGKKAPKCTTPGVQLKDYDYMITKKKLEEDDDFQSVLTPVTEFTTAAVGDAALAALKKGDILQLERRGYYICDAKDGKTITLISIPDGKAASLASKHNVNAAASAAASSPAASPSPAAAAKKSNKAAAPAAAAAKPEVSPATHAEPASAPVSIAAAPAPAIPAPAAPSPAAKPAPVPEPEPVAASDEVKDEPAAIETAPKDEEASPEKSQASAPTSVTPSPTKTKNTPKKQGSKKGKNKRK